MKKRVVGFVFLVLLASFVSAHEIHNEESFMEKVVHFFQDRFGLSDDADLSPAAVGSVERVSEFEGPEVQLYDRDSILRRIGWINENGEYTEAEGFLEVLHYHNEDHTQAEDI